MAEEAWYLCVDVSSSEFIKSYASLKNSDMFDLPVWADTVKTVSTRSWPSNGDDWYSHPAASHRA
jgi:ribosomal protein S19E (S16A)